MTPRTFLAAVPILILICLLAAACGPMEDLPISSTHQAAVDPNAVTLRTKFFAGTAGTTQPSLKRPVIYADIDGDGYDEACAYTTTCWSRFMCTTRANEHRCSPPQVGPAAQERTCETVPDETGINWGTAQVEIRFPNLANLISNERYPIMFADLNNDQKADVCMRQPDGVYCSISRGNAFGAATRWTTQFRDSDGWNSRRSYHQTITLVDIDGDGRASICGRGTHGVYCAESNGSRFGPVYLAASSFSNGNGWTDPKYYSTMQYADVNDDGYLDLCARGKKGIYCAEYDEVFTHAFKAARKWTSLFSDAYGWGHHKYYSTIKFADIDNDGKADVCGRGPDGVYCGMADISSRFVGAHTRHATFFADSNQYDQQRFYRSFFVVDVNGDNKADICGRHTDGIYCAMYTGTLFKAQFAPAVRWLTSFGDNHGWGNDPRLWFSVQPAKVRGADDTIKFCGRGYKGVYCSNK